MDELVKGVGLCLPRLTPKYVCMLRCTCSVLRDMSVSWQDHSIDFQLDGSASATSWLQKNIGTMKKLNLVITAAQPQRTLQDVMEGGR